MTNIRTSPPSLVGQPKISFIPEAFDAAIWNNGYRVVHEEARQCPCQSRESGSPRPECQNCRGFGLVFINPTETMAIISGINRKTKYGEEWSEVSMGTIACTLRNVNRLAENDRITFIDVFSKRSETLRVRTVDNQAFVFLTYHPVELLDVFYFADPLLPLVKLTPGLDYELDPDNAYIMNCKFQQPDGFNNTVTVTYTYQAQYHVYDTPHDIRASQVLNNNGQQVSADLPIQAILRKAHIALSMNDRQGEGAVNLINNSYK
jgi:hypothetical protein